jgi:hypothetical protein
MPFQGVDFPKIAHKPAFGPAEGLCMEPNQAAVFIVLHLRGSPQ